MFRLALVLLFSGSLVEVVRSQSGGDTGKKNDTTIEFQKLFLNRCLTFQEMHPEVFRDNKKNCTLLWDLFVHSFANRNSCDIHPENYTEFLREANHTVAITDKAMFWSSVFGFVYTFTNSQPNKYFTILDLLPAYILNDSSWCWSLEKGDFDNDNCPNYRSCPGEYEAVRSFWKATSRMYARLATGKVYAMLNGSLVGGAFTNRSLFYTVEVPAMESPRIKEMQVILVQNLKGPFSEFCGSGTLLTLNKTMTEKEIKFSCTENPPEVKCLLGSTRDCQPACTENCSASGAPSTGHVGLSDNFGRTTAIIVAIFCVAKTSLAHSIY